MNTVSGGIKEWKVPIDSEFILSVTSKTGRYIVLCNIHNTWNKPKNVNKKPYFLPYTRNQVQILIVHER